MRRNNVISFALAFTSLIAIGLESADAACTLPFQLTNGQSADATQVMANFNALVACLNNGVPGGSTNAIQYNAGSGTLGGVGPLTDGQLVIGTTGGAPQAQTLTAGPGITVTNGPGAITIGTAGLNGAGLYHQIMSATPTSASTGLTNWLNQGSAAVADSAVGISITVQPSGTSANLTGRFMAAPTPPYKITALIAATRSSNSFSGVGIGWYDGVGKLQTIFFTTNNGGGNIIQLINWNSITSNTVVSQTFNNAYSQPIWLQIQDDGTSVTLGVSQDGANFLSFPSIVKSSGFLGANGYSNIGFFINPQGGGLTFGTLMSWTRN